MFISQKIDNFVLKACRDFNTPESALQGLVYKKQHSIADKLILQQCFIQSKKMLQIGGVIACLCFQEIIVNEPHFPLNSNSKTAIPSKCFS